MNYREPHTVTLTLEEWRDIDSALQTAMLRHRGRRLYSERIEDEDEANASGMHEESYRLLLEKLREAIPTADTRLNSRINPPRK